MFMFYIYLTSFFLLFTLFVSPYNGISIDVNVFTDVVSGLSVAIY